MEKEFSKVSTSSYENNFSDFHLCHFSTGKVEERKESKKVKVGGMKIEEEKSGRRKNHSSPVFR